MLLTPWQLTEAQAEMLKAREQWLLALAEWCELDSNRARELILIRNVLKERELAPGRTVWNWDTTIWTEPHRMIMLPAAEPERGPVPRKLANNSGRRGLQKLKQKALAGKRRKH